MSDMSRRELLRFFALAPTLPYFVVQSAEAAAADGAADDGRIVVVVRMLGGNDGLNTVVPFRDDRYHKARPTIALSASDVIQLPGRDFGLNPHMTDIHRLMDEGIAGIVQGVGYPQSSRSHSRSTEILEAGSLADPAPAQGWLGRYLDHACECDAHTVAGVQFSDEMGLTLASKNNHSRSIGHPQLLLEMGEHKSAADARGARAGRLDYLRQVENALGDSSRELHRAARGSGSTFDYPDTPFGQSLRWTGDMIEAGCPTRVYYVTIGSFATPDLASFDTHIDQLLKHKILFTELGQGLRSFAAHMQKAGQFNRVLALTFSDFGRQLAENRTHGTDHGDAGLLFFMGGAVQAGLHGQPADLSNVKDGGLQASVDFRQIYSNVLQSWLRTDATAILGETLTPFPIVA